MESLLAGIVGFFGGIVLTLGWWAWPLFFVLIGTSAFCGFRHYDDDRYGNRGRRRSRIWAGLLLIPSLLLFYNLVGWGLLAFIQDHWKTLLWVVGGSLVIGIFWCIFGRWNLTHMRFSVEAKKALADFIAEWSRRLDKTIDFDNWDLELFKLGYAPAMPEGHGSVKQKYERISDSDKKAAEDKRLAAVAALKGGNLPEELQVIWDRSMYSRKPVASEHKAEIAYWIFCWIIDIPVYVVTDLAWDFIDGVIKKFGRVFSWVASWHYKDVDARYIR